jgi:hypothetical protein
VGWLFIHKARDNSIINTFNSPGSQAKQNHVTGGFMWGCRGGEHVSLFPLNNSTSSLSMEGMHISMFMAKWFNSKIGPDLMSHDPSFHQTLWSTKINPKHVQDTGMLDPFRRNYQTGNMWFNQAYFNGFTDTLIHVSDCLVRVLLRISHYFVSYN